MLRNQKRPGSGQLKSTGAVPGASRMSALGHKQTFRDAEAMSALPPKADVCGALAHVCFGPIADIVRLIRSPRPRDRERLPEFVGRLLWQF